MTRTASLFLAVVAVSCLSGCATPFQSTAFRGGYSETQLAPDVFRIYFRGNAFTSAERAQDFALLRAAQLARDRGFAFFAVVDESNWSSIHTYTTPGQSYTSGTATFTGNYATYSGQTTYHPGQTFLMHKPRTGLVVRCFAERPQGTYVFEAAFLEQSLKQKYGLK